MGKKVLLIENNKVDARNLGKFLKEKGYEVLLSTDGQAGLEIFGTSAPDIVIVDMLIPKISGSELCLKLKATPLGQTVPIVLISSIFKNMQLDRIAKSRWEADGFMEKPMDNEALAEMMEKLLADFEGKKLEIPEPPPAEAPQETSAEPEEAGEGESPPEDRARQPEIPETGAAQPDTPESEAEQPEVPEPDGPAAVEIPAAQAPKTKKVIRTEEFHLKEVSEEGSLSDVSLPEILAFLYYANASGILTLSNGEANKKVYLSEGNPVYVESMLREESLGRILVTEGLITEEDCYLSLQTMKTFSLKQGGALVHMGVLSPLQLLGALKNQMREKVLSLFTWFEGSYRFENKRVKAGQITFFEMDAPDIVIEGIRRFYDPSKLRETFEEIRFLRLLRKSALPFNLGSLKLGDQERRLLYLADGTRTVERIVRESGLEMSECFLVLYALMILGVFQGIFEEEVSETDSASAPAFPDIEFLEEQAEAAALLVEGHALAGSEFTEDPTGEIPAEPNREKPVMLEDPERPPAQAELSTEDQALRDRILSDFLALEGANHYQVLGLERDVDVEQIKKAYMDLAKTYHADTFRTKFDPGIVQKANDVFTRATEAYKTLINAQRRVKYDKRLTESGEEKRELTISNVLMAENNFSKGMELLKRRSYADAAKVFQEAIDQFPEESEYYAYLGWASFHSQDVAAADRFEVAKDLIQKAISLNPKSDVAYLFLGKILKSKGMRDQAAQAFAHSFKYNRNNQEAKNELKMIQYEKMKEKRAKEGEKEKSSLRGILTKDMDLDTIKKSILRIFWS